VFTSAVDPTPSSVLLTISSKLFRRNLFGVTPFLQNLKKKKNKRRWIEISGPKEGLKNGLKLFFTKAAFFAERSEAALLPSDFQFQPRIPLTSPDDRI
jgi:hypothetical protein